MTIDGLVTLLTLIVAVFAVLPRYRRLLANLSPNSRTVDLESEFPTKYEFLIYEIIDNLLRWVGAVQYLPQNQDNIVLRSTSNTHENGNIPKSALLCLGICLRQLVLAENSTPRFKRDMIRMAFKRYFDLRSLIAGGQIQHDYATALANSICCGGFNTRNIDPEYSEILKEVSNEIEWRIKYADAYVQELKDLL